MKPFDPRNLEPDDPAREVRRCPIGVALASEEELPDVTRERVDALGTRFEDLESVALTFDEDLQDPSFYAEAFGNAKARWIELYEVGG